jgi:hypothetical protein
MGVSGLQIARSSVQLAIRPFAERSAAVAQFLCDSACSGNYRDQRTNAKMGVHAIPLPSAASEN